MYNSPVKYIKGKINVRTGALSRVSISDLKKGSDQIFAITRSMSVKEKTNFKQPIEKQNDVQLRIYDKFNKNISKTRTKIIKTNDNGKTLCINHFRIFSKLLTIEFKYVN